MIAIYYYLLYYAIMDEDITVIDPEIQVASIDKDILDNEIHQESPRPDATKDIIRLKKTNPKLTTRQLAKLVDRNHSTVVK